MSALSRHQKSNEHVPDSRFTSLELVQPLFRGLKMIFQSLHPVANDLSLVKLEAHANIAKMNSLGFVFLIAFASPSAQAPMSLTSEVSQSRRRCLLCQTEQSPPFSWSLCEQMF